LIISGLSSSLYPSKLKRSIIGLDNEKLLNEVRPLMNPKLNLFAIEGGQYIKLNLSEVEKFAQRKNINYYKIKSHSHELKREEGASLYSEEAQKRM